MKLTLHRFHYDPDYTVGRLHINGEYQCFTLEDAVREIPGQPVRQWKIQDRTAIPSGTYDVALTYSQRFRRILPLLRDVPGFTGVRIHTGNSSANTEGCILVGQDYNGGDWIDKSRLAFGPLYERMADAYANGERITLRIER